MKTKPTDARRLSAKELTDLRNRGIRAVQNGESPEAVASVPGVSRAAVYSWLSLYRSGGWYALNAGKRGGRKPKVDAKVMRGLYKTVTA